MAASITVRLRASKWVAAHLNTSRTIASSRPKSSTIDRRAEPQITISDHDIKAWVLKFTNCTYLNRSSKQPVAYPKLATTKIENPQQMHIQNPAMIIDRLASNQEACSNRTQKHPVAQI
ncbi:hypothetical protein ACLOJK_023973 [Asimina triloba]